LLLLIDDGVMCSPAHYTVMLAIILCIIFMFVLSLWWLIRFTVCVILSCQLALAYFTCIIFGASLCSALSTTMMSQLCII